jgi:hypothetical protein
MDDLGAPGSYLTLAEGTRVLSADGRELGRVRRVFADPEVDVFDGFVIQPACCPAEIGSSRRARSRRSSSAAWC